VVGLCDAEACLEQIDVGRIATLADRRGLEDATTAAQDTDDWSVANLVKLARLFGCQPIDVMDWPFDCFPAVWEALALLGEVKLGEPSAGDYSAMQREFIEQHARMAKEKAN
jgi:hypothetical protein